MSGDYSACENKTCRLRLKCYRYMMKRSQYQVVSGFKLEPVGTGRNAREVCEGFSELRPGDAVRTLESSN